MSAAFTLPPPRTLLAASAVLALAGCGGQQEGVFAPPCPVPSIPRDFNDLHRYRGGGRDITDSVLEGRITGINGACTRAGPGIVAATVSVNLELARGPASTSRVAQLAYFVAVSEGERILDKQVYQIAAEFPQNTDRLRLRGDDVELRLPISDTKTAAAYRISVGFQLTPLELETNQRPR